MKLHSNGYKILIVDSSLMIVDRLNNLLSEMSCDNCISSANNYEEAVEKLLAEKYDIVLLDTQLQGKNGFELLSYIKLNCPDTKTVMITNQTSDFYKMKGKQIYLKISNELKL